MKSVRWFSLLVALVTVFPLLTACTPTDTNSGTTNAPPAPVASNASGPGSPQTAATPVPGYPGAIDKSDCVAVGGWVVNGKDPKLETKVELYVDNKLVETIPANSMRPDLTSWGTGLHGFVFTFPAAYKDGKLHVAAVKVAGTDYSIPFWEGRSPNIQCKP